MLERYSPAKKPENNGEAIFRESGSEKGGKERTEVAGCGKEEKRTKEKRWQEHDTSTESAL